MAIDGMDNWLKKLEAMKKDFPKETGKFLMKKASETIGNTKSYTPVDTGTLKNAWQRQNGGSFKQIIYNNCSYSADVEWGHRQEVGRYVPKLKKRLKNPFVRGHRMLHKAMNRTKLSFYRDLGTVYKNLIEK